MNAPKKSPAVRRPLDAYFTPTELASAVVARVAASIHAPGRILEPSSGGGAFVAACRDAWPSADILAADVDASRKDIALGCGADRFRCADFLHVQPHPGAFVPDLIIGNPPYFDAEAHVRKALEIVAPGGPVVMLLRLSMVASKGRLVCGGIARAGAEGCGLHAVLPVFPRPSFTGGGSDNSEYAVCVWKKGYRGQIEYALPLEWQPSKKARKGKAATP